MPIAIAPLHPSDFPILLSHASSPHGDLAAPITALFWPLTEGTPEDGTPSPASASRLRWSLAQQRNIFENDSTAHFVKAVDSESGEIIALARWHYYPNGWDSDSMAWREVNWNGGSKNLSEVSAEGMDEEAVMGGLHVPGWVGFHTKAFETRERFVGADGKRTGAFWVLTTLVTRPGFRRRGAGTKLVQWGLERAAEGGEPAYLEAGPNGRPVYEKLGFREVGKIEIDMRDLGMDRVVKLSQMKWETQAQDEQI